MITRKLVNSAILSKGYFINGILIVLVIACCLGVFKIPKIRGLLNRILFPLFFLKRVFSQKAIRKRKNQYENYLIRNLNEKHDEKDVTEYSESLDEIPSESYDSVELVQPEPVTNSYSITTSSINEFKSVNHSSTDTIADLENLEPVKRRYHRPYYRKTPTEKILKKKTLKKSKDDFISYQTWKILSPKVEMDIEEGMIFLIIPEQTISVKDVRNQRYVTYSIKIDTMPDEEYEVELYPVTEEKFHTEELSIELKSELASFEVKYPPEVKNKLFTFNNPTYDYYVFIQGYDNKAQMILDTTRIPGQRSIFLLPTDISIDKKPDLIDDVFIWGRFQPHYIDLTGYSEIILSSRNGTKTKISCNPTFNLKGKLIRDHLVEKSPLFIDDTIWIRPTSKSANNWTVWLLNRNLEKICIHKNWTAEDPLPIKMNHLVNSVFGEFMIGFCSDSDLNPENVCYFRWISDLSFDYPQKLLLAQDLKQKSVKISIKSFLLETLNVELSNTKSSFKRINNELGEIILKSWSEPLEIKLVSINNPSIYLIVSINLRILDWELLGFTDEISKMKFIPPNLLEAGKKCKLIINTGYSDFPRCNIVLENLRSREEIQTTLCVKEKFKQYCELNVFYDTIKAYPSQTALFLYIDGRKNQLIRFEAGEAFQNIQKRRTDHPPITDVSKKTTTSYPSIEYLRMGKEEAKSYLLKRCVNFLSSHESKLERLVNKKTHKQVGWICQICGYKIYYSKKIDRYTGKRKRPRKSKKQRWRHRR